LVVERALAAGCLPKVVMCDERFAATFDQPVSDRGGSVIEATADVRREVTGLGVPLGAIGVFERPPVRDVNELCASARRIVLLGATWGRSPVRRRPWAGTLWFSTAHRQTLSLAEPFA